MFEKDLRAVREQKTDNKNNNFTMSSHLLHMRYDMQPND